VGIADRCHGIGMKNNVFFFADCRQLGNGLDGSDLGIGMHNRNNNRLGPDGPGEALGINQAVFIDRQKGGLKVQAF